MENTGEILARMDEETAVSTLRNLASACFANAQSLSDDAIPLLNEGRVRGAYALAVIGIEEFAKAVLHTVAALRPAERGMLGAEVRSHEVKHLIAANAEYAQIEVAEGWLVAEQESGMRVPQRARLEDLVGNLLKRGVAGLLQEPKQAKAFYAELRQKFSDHLVEPDFKNVAFYADLLPTGEVVTPERVLKEMASPVSSLEWFVEVYKGLDEVLRDDTWWERFVRGVRREPQESVAA